MAYGISKAAQYAIRALVFLARQGDGEVVPVREIAEAEGIPHHFLAKLAGTLVQAGIVEAHKGPGGGMRLVPPASAVDLSEVIEVIDGPSFLEGCLLGFTACGDDHPCPMHEEWKRLRAQLVEDVQRITIAQLAHSAGGGQPERGSRKKQR